MITRAIQDITDFIFMEDTPLMCDVILIPGTSKSAITEKAAELYRAGYATYVMPSGLYSSSLGRFASENIDNPRYAGEYATDFEYCKHILMENGVPEQAILREDRATNSMENAMYSTQALRDAGIEVKRAIICCQAFHARRAFLSYACHFGSAELIVVPMATQGISRANWYKSEKGFRKIMGEVAKCGVYFKDMGEVLKLSSFTTNCLNYTIIPYDEKYRDDMIFMVLQAKDALGRIPGLNEDLLDIRKHYLDTGDVFWLAIDEHDRVIGSIGYKSIPGTTEVRLHRLYIKASLKRRGIGTNLLHTAEAHLRRQGKTAVHVHLGGKEYFESRSFYPKHGYREYAPDYMKKELV